ncbi:hypothetical protein GOP47_0006033 [Adiantum capillus-veneris]|uniref:EngB-type G domain-containing protein n=1 Tax=Adiantum capillus-veneris TaxID=13818 RepID=A0A9D4V2Z4_ADICA|nr:hypothetical protein GOP47_0006033 [Adiantum capillus-veneris]
MAGLCLKGHYALTSLPVTGKGRGLHGLSSSSCRPLHIITAKAGQKLEAKEPKQTPEPKRASNPSDAPKNITFSAEIDGKQVEITLLQVVAANQMNPQKAGKKKKKKKNGNLQKNVGEELAVQAVKTTSADEEEDEVEDADDDKDSDEEAAEESEDPDEQESDDDSELEEVMEMFIPPGAVFSPEKPLSKLPGSNIYLGPYARGGRIKEAEFVKSSTCTAECPPHLALTSKKPGKTQLINHFIINKSWYLVDLPGYGYAKAPGSVRATWDNFTKDFFLQSKSLVCVMLLVDASIPPQEIDLEYADWLHQNKVPMTIVFTKCDRKKKKKNGGRKPIENIKDFLRSVKEKLDKLPPWIMTSSVSHQGKDGLFLHMSQLRNYWSS